MALIPSCSIAIMHLALCGAASASENIILATADKPEQALLKQVRAVSLAEATAELKKKGYVEVIRANRTYMVGPELMQDSIYKNLPAFYESISKRSSGAFTVGSDEPLLRFVQAAFGDRFDALDKAKFVLGGASQVEINADGRTILIKRESALTPEERKEVENSPLQRRDPQRPATELPRLDEFSPVQCDRIHLTVLGKPEYRQFTWAKDLNEVSKVLDERLQELHGAATAALHGLFERLPAHDVMREVGRLERGASFSSLSPALRNALGGGILGDPKAFGFADEVEAEQFLARAQIGGIKKGIKITGAKGKASFISIALFP